MENNKIVSLCYVSSKNEKTAVLCRIADYINERFVPYAYNPNRDFFGEERDLLYGQNYDVLAEEGEIAVFNWYTYQNSDNQWRTEVKRNNDVSWCEVLYMEKYDNPFILAREIKEGLTLKTKYDMKHDLILISRKDAMGLNALYLKKGTVRTNGNLLLYSNDVIKIPVGYTDMRMATGSCQCRYLQTDQRFLRGRDGFTAKKLYMVKKPVEVVRDIIQGNVGYFDADVMTRREKQLLRSVLSRVTEPTIVDMVCDRVNCTVQEANDYIHQYIEAAELKMDQQTALSIIQKVVESDVDAVLEMKKTVKEEWLSENDALIAEKKKEIDHYQHVVNTAKEMAEETNNAIRMNTLAEENKQKALIHKNEELTNSIANLQKLKADLENEIQERLNNAKENLAGKLLDQAMFQMNTQSQPQTNNQTKAPKAYSISCQNEETEKADINDCFDVAQTDWNRVCGDEDMASGLALLALSIFACNRSVLVAGDGAEAIADMLSVSVCGHVPLKIHIRDEADLDELIDETDAHDHQVICIINGLESGYAIGRELMERFRGSRFIFTTLHGESLAMEPDSLFSTFFPVLTEYFYNGRHVQEYSTLDCREDLLNLENSEQEKQAFREAKKIVGKWLRDDFFPPLIKIRFAKLIASMIMLAKKLGLSNTILHSAELELVLTPWLKCLRKQEILTKILEEDNVLDEFKKKDLLRYIGSDKMG